MEESIMQSDTADRIRARFDLSKMDIKTYSPLTLAFMGDCVFDLFIRTMLTAGGNRGVNGLHKDKSNLVNAKAQSAMADLIADILTAEETDVYKRGRNAKTASHAKNADLSDYHKATGFEALLGYLYLDGREERAHEIMEYAVKEYRKSGKKE